MTEEERKQLAEIEEKTRVLIAVHKQIKAKNAELKSALEEERLRAEALTEEVQNLKMENASLKAATAVAYSRSEAIAEKERIQSLIRKIDRCVALLMTKK